MKIDITGRNIEVTPALKKHAADKLGKLTKLLDEPIDTHVVLFIEKHRHVAEIQVKSKAGVFSGTEETGDLYVSIGEVADKLERQVLKHKEKATAKRRREAARVPDVAVAMNEQGEETAAEAGKIVDLPAGLGKRIVRSTRYQPEALTAEEAIARLESTGTEVLVFRDTASERMQVVHKLQDGNYELVDAET